MGGLRRLTGHNRRHLVTLISRNREGWAEEGCVEEGGRVAEGGMGEREASVGWRRSEPVVSWRRRR